MELPLDDDIENLNACIKKLLYQVFEAIKKNATNYYKFKKVTLTNLTPLFIKMLIFHTGAS